MLGFTDEAARTAFFASREIAGLSTRLARHASAVHAYDMSALTFVRDGAILAHYQE
jgi:hypothetical protein